jgi:Heparinase II/III-like protein/Heparinase II/III N-terminus
VIGALDKLRTAYRLGPTNILRVFAYRAAVKTGFYRRLLPAGGPIAGPFIAFASGAGQPPARLANAHWRAEADLVMAGRLRLFSDQILESGFPPDWRSNTLTGNSAIPSGLHWTRIDPMGRPGDDIKGYWELSRFDGLIALTLGWLVGRDPRVAEAWNLWLSDWSQHNPANTGINWLCGQESGVRLLHTLLCAELVVMHSASQVLAPLERFAAEHCRRIEPTMLYAAAQDNNHGISEAAALYVGGGWLRRRGNHEGAERWMDLGRRWLERLVARLIMPDGSFAQHSVNYHRLMLDTLSLVEFWRRRLDDRRFSDLFNARFQAAANWLTALTDPESGDASNLGANDGARIAALHGLAYRDFRPSIELAHVLSGAAILPDGPWNEPLEWLGVELPPAARMEWGSTLFPDGGYAKLVRGRAWCLLRLPCFRFRPSHCDVLHLDLWNRGLNVLRDGGSYSYNAEPEAMRYFSGTASHNTVQFDDRDQMPRLRPFLFGAWPDCDELHYDGGIPMVCAAYRDSWGASHRRSVELTEGGCIVRDEFADFRARAVLRWRLAPARWRLEGMTVSSPLGALSITSSTTPAGVTMVDGWESLHYGSRAQIPVLEVVFDRPVEVTTTIRLDGIP